MLPVAALGEGVARVHAAALREDHILLRFLGAHGGHGIVPDPDLALHDAHHGELVDLVLVNKCDGDLLPAARRAKLEYMSAIKLLRRRNPLWSPTVLSVSAIKHTGLEDTWDSMTT